MGPGGREGGKVGGERGTRRRERGVYCETD